MTEDEHAYPDRVRLPRSLFESLQSNRSEVLLAVTILDIGPGNLFKVRRGLEEARGSSAGQRLVHQGPASQLAFFGVFAVGPSGDGGGVSLWSVLKQPEVSPDFCLWSLCTAHSHWSHTLRCLHPTHQCPWTCTCIPSVHVPLCVLVHGQTCLFFHSPGVHAIVHVPG